jgi:hypothetical protein
MRHGEACNDAALCTPLILGVGVTALVHFRGQVNAHVRG